MFGSQEIWEVWMWHDDRGEYFVRYVAVDGDNKRYFADFAQYNTFVSNLWTGLRDELVALKNKEHPQNVKLYIAGGVFVASAVVLFYLILTGAEPNATTFSTFATLIASGGFMFFGHWLSGR